MKTFRSYSEVSACVGQEVAVTDWITITQEQVNLFAQATGDHQWIHVDPERAKAGPFGAHCPWLSHAVADSAVF